MTRYHHQSRVLAAVDCIIFGFDGQELKLLLIKRSFDPEQGKWSLMGGFIQPGEGPDKAASRILRTLTGLDGVYLQQLGAFGEPERDPIERTISIAYSSLIDIQEYNHRISQDYEAQWFPINKIPTLIFDHNEMVETAKKRLRYNAALHPVLFELLPGKFTLPQLQKLYESTYDTEFDKRNFSRKILSTGLLIKQKDKDKSGSKRGAYYYKLNTRNYKNALQAIINLIPNPGDLGQ